MKILVTGGTGFTGHNLSKKLLADGHQVRLLVRSRARVALPADPRLEIVEGDIRDPKAVDQAVAGVERVFNIAAMFRTAGSVDADYHDIHVKGTSHLVEAALRHQVRRFVHCSTVGVHGDVQGLASEESPFAPGDIYQRTKLEGELLAREFAEKHGLPLSVVRPTAIYGPGDIRLLKLFRLAVKKFIPVIGTGKILYHMVYIDDLVRGFILAAEREEALGEVFIIGGGENMALDQLLTTIAGIVHGSSGTLFHLPARPFQLAGTLCEKICIPLGVEPPIYRRRVDFFTKSRNFSIAKAQRLLGYQPAVGLETGLRQTAQWYREQGLL